MSGSSLDGLDIAYCQFTFTDTWSFELIHSKNAQLGIWEDLLRSAKDLKKEELQNLNLDFAVFLPLVFIIYWAFNNKNITYQNIILVIASYVFYGWWDWRFLSLIFFSTLVDFLVGYFL